VFFSIFFTYSGGIFSSFFRYPRPLGKRPPSVFSSRQDNTMTVRKVRFFQLPIFPLPAGAVDRFTIRDKLIDELHLPKKTSRLPDARGFTVVEGWVPRDTNNYVYHVALKIHGHAKSRPLQEAIQALFDPASTPQIEVRGIAGWDRMCKRIFSEVPDFWVRRYQADPTEEVEDRDEIQSLYDKYVRNPGRARRHLNAYIGVKRGARRTKRDDRPPEGPR
jgi:hypothetical protein